LRKIYSSLGPHEKANNFSEFIKKINEFIDNNIGLEIFISIDVEEERTKQNIMKYVSYLNANLAAINPDLISDFYVEEQLKLLSERIKSILELIDEPLWKLLNRLFL